MSNYRIYDAVFPGIAFSHLSDGERYRSERYVIKGLPQRVQNFAKAFFFESNGTIEDAARLLNISVAYAEKQYKDCLYQFRENQQIRTCLTDGLSAYREDVLSRCSKQTLVNELNSKPYLLSWCADIDSYILADAYGKDPSARSVVTLGLPSSVVWSLLKQDMRSVQHILSRGEEGLKKLAGVGLVNRNLIRKTLSDEGYNVKSLGPIEEADNKDYSKDRSLEVIESKLDDAFERLWGNNRPSGIALNMIANYLYEEGIRITKQAHESTPYKVEDSVKDHIQIAGRDLYV